MFDDVLMFDNSVLFTQSFFCCDDYEASLRERQRHSQKKKNYCALNLTHNSKIYKKINVLQSYFAVIWLNINECSYCDDV